MAAAVAGNITDKPVPSELLDSTAVSTEVNFNDTGSVSDDLTMGDTSSANDTMKDDSGQEGDEDDGIKAMDVQDTKSLKINPGAQKQLEELDTNAAERIKSTSFRRERKQVQPFVALQSRVAKKASIVIVPGKGDKFSEISSVAEFIDKKNVAELTPLHYICFGKAGAKTDVKKNLLNFSGYPFELTSTEYANRNQLLIKKIDSSSFKKMCSKLGITGTTNKTKPELIGLLMTFCLKPEGTDLKPQTPKLKSNPSPKRKGSAKNTQKAEKLPNKSKDTGKKRKKDEDTHSGEESENENDKSFHSKGRVEPPSKRSRNSMSKNVHSDEEKPEAVSGSESDYNSKEEARKKNRKATHNLKVKTTSKSKGKAEIKKKPHTSNGDQEVKSRKHEAVSDSESDHNGEEKVRQKKRKASQKLKVNKTNLNPKDKTQIEKKQSNSNGDQEQEEA